jgi:hypothetical protein
MAECEYLTAVVTANSSGNLDLVLQRDKPSLFEETPARVDAYFNITQDDCDTQIDRLRQIGWELFDVAVESPGGTRMYYFKRQRNPN